MKSIIRLIFFLAIPQLGLSQSYTIDSVVIRHCRAYCDAPDFYTVTVDSFDTRGLLINSNTTDTNGVPQYQTLNSWSPENKLLHSMQNQYTNGSWQTLIEENDQYDLNDSLILSQRMNYLYSSPGVVYTAYGYRTLISYDLVLNTRMLISQQYDFPNGIWNNQNRYTYSYDSFGRTISYAVETWNNTSNAFLLTTRYWDFYLPNNSLDYYTYQSFSLATSLPSDSNLVDYSYDGSGNLTQLLQSSWSSSASSWSPVQVDHYFYDNHQNCTGYSSHEWVGPPFGWDAAGDTMFSTFDNQDRLLTFESNFYTGGGNSGWNVYNPAGLIDSSNSCSWSHGGNCSCSTCAFDYVPLHNSGITYLNRDNEFQLYPNPVMDELDLRLPSDKASEMTLEDIRGCVLKKINSTGKYFKWNLSDLDNGIYFVRVFTQRENYTKKILVIH